MNQEFIYCAGGTEATNFARTYLLEAGLPIADTPTPFVKHLLLDVPSFGENGQLRMGGDIQTLLKHLPDDVKIYGGNLCHSALKNYQVADFLQDEN